MDYKCNSKVSISGSLHVIPCNGSVGNPFISFNKRSHFNLAFINKCFRTFVRNVRKKICRQSVRLVIPPYYLREWIIPWGDMHAGIEKASTSSWFRVFLSPALDCRLTQWHLKERRERKKEEKTATILANKLIPFLHELQHYSCIAT